MSEALIGVLIGSMTTLVASVVVPLIAGTVRRRADARASSLREMKALVPRLLELAMGNVQRNRSTNTMEAVASPREVRLMMELEMLAEPADRSMVTVVKMATASARAFDERAGRTCVLAAMSVMPYWVEQGRLSSRVHQGYLAIIRAEGVMEGPSGPRSGDF
jgi:hypothetical protein